MLQKQSNKVRHTTALFLTNYVSFCVSSRSPKRMSLFNIGQIGLVLVKKTLFGHGKVWIFPTICAHNSSVDDNNNYNATTTTKATTLARFSNLSPWRYFTKGPFFNFQKWTIETSRTTCCLLWDDCIDILGYEVGGESKHGPLKEKEIKTRIGPSGKLLCMWQTPKIMATFLTCLTIGPIRLFILLYF